MVRSKKALVLLAASTLVVAHGLYKLVIVGHALSTSADKVLKLRGVKKSWVPGLTVDLSDHQWREFRSALPILALALGVYVALSRQMKRLPKKDYSLFLLAFSSLFLGACHGTFVIPVIVLACLNFLVVQVVAGRRGGLLGIWLWNVGCLLWVKTLDGAHFGSLAHSLAFLDAHGGMLRWHVHYNFMALRMISFGADFCWMKKTIHANESKSNAVKSAEQPGVRNLKRRTETDLAPHYYSWQNYFLYLLYPPLYIAGPIMSFNCFISQQISPDPPSAKQVLLYGLRLLVCLCMLEAITHALHMNALAQGRAWEQLQRGNHTLLSPLQVASIGFWVLMFMWLKFLVIWRFFRLVTLADGLECAENMTRCICSNYTIQDFWRGWHASYNAWLVRYLYIPLGGRRWRALNAWPIFTFVAVWHDLEWRLFGWAWLMSLFLLPEMIAGWIGAQCWFFEDKNGFLFQNLAAIAAAFNMILLMAINLVGFVFGLEGLGEMLKLLLSQPSFVCAMIVSLFCTAHVIFFIRNRPKANVSC